MSSDSESLSLSPPRKHKKSSYSNGSSSSSEPRKHKKSADSGSSLQSSKHKNSTDELLQVVQTKHSKKLKKSDDAKSISDPIEMYRNHDRGGKISADLTEDIVGHHLHLYNGILEFVPSLRMELDTISTDKLSKIISAITKGMSDTQSTAFSSVKHKGLKYVPFNMHSKNDALDPPIPEVEDKSMRGIAHPQLACWLCPRNKLHVFDSDPEEGMEKLQSGKIKMAATSWPTGFYENGVYDSQDKTKGLFRNHVVARFYTHLYIGPSAAMSESTSSKASKQARNCAFSLLSVTKHIIAIVHIITYFTLSNVQNWTNKIGTMNLEVLFWAIIDMLNDDEDPWVKDTMSWWNARMGSAQAKFIKKPSDSEDDSEENDIADIKAQRLARRGAVPPQRKAPNEAKRPAAAALFDDDEPEYPSSKKTPTAPLPQPVKPRPRPQLVVQESSDEDPVPVVPPSTRPASKKIRTDLHRPPIEQSDDDEHSPPLAAKKKPIVESSKRRRLPESDEDHVEYRALSPSTPPAKKTQPHTRITKRPQPILTDDEEHTPLSESFPPPAKKIRSDSPLPPLTEDEDDEPSPPSPPPPMKPANKVAPCPAVLLSPQPAATKARVSLKLKLAPANQPSIEDEDITRNAPAVPKKKGKKTSPAEATKWNPPRNKKRTNGF
ncbi:hypothetical protein F4604DRAFT_1940290 [Suillus subluteus]|nr:hypothetical protein F4604DRAFT_1940290 [Suillus subluteus]